VIAVVVLAAIGAGMWWMSSPTRRFLQGFSRLVQDPRRHYLLEDLRLVRWVEASYGGRRVTLQLVPPVASESQSFEFGMVLLTMDVRAPDGSAWKDSTRTLGNPELSRATFDLEGRYELRLTLADGSLEAVWSPPAGRMFPGPFDEARWRNTLAQMRVVAEWLERATGDGEQPH
jgi:hypothetical protein